MTCNTGTYCALSVFLQKGRIYLDKTLKHIYSLNYQISRMFLPVLVQESASQNGYHIINQGIIL